MQWVISIQEIHQALILAGGEGTRLRPITEKIPKCMVKINGRPFLEHQLELLARNGITDVVLCVGHLWEHIKNHFGETYTTRQGTRLVLHYSVEPRFLGTGGAVKNAERFADDFFFILYGDTYNPLDCQAMGKLLLERNSVGVISVYDNSDNIAQNNVQVDRDGTVLKYDKHRASPDMNGVEAGALGFSKELFNYLPDLAKLGHDQKISLEIDIYPTLIDQRQLLGYMTNIRFYDMGTPERIKIISEVLK